MVVPQAAINNIMGGIESTGGVRLHNHRRKLKQRFDIVRKLGQGNYGKVQLGINKETGQEVAIKTIKKCKIETEADLIRIRREIQIMSSVQHPNIIHIYEVFENREKMVLVMEYAAGGELYDFLDQKKVLTEEEARRIFRQIATAVYYCHKHKICHRDLKLENILLDENGNAKIADFGLSNVFTESRFLSTFCGSPLYASPEIVKGIPYHGPEVDCWSLGVLLYTLVYGAMPFDGSNFKRLVKQISNGDYFEPKNQSTASPLIAEMLNINPSSRADITVICSHWWIDKDQTVACLYEAEELANQTPVRLDLLLSLAPSPSTDKIVVGADVPISGDGTRPLRSQSLGNIPPIMEVPSEQLAPTLTEKQETQPFDNAVPAVGKRKDKSTSKVKGEREESKKTEDIKAQAKAGNTLDEPQAVVQEPITPVAEHPQPPCSDIGAEEIYPDETALETLTPNTPDPLVSEPITPLPPGFVPDDNSSKETTSSEDKTGPSLVVSNEVSIKPVPSQNEPSPVEPKPVEAKPYKERRRSSVLETVEKFNKQPAAPLKKIIIPGTKVTGGVPAKKVYERKPSTGTAIPLTNSTSRKSLAEISPNIQPPAKTTVPRTTESPNRKIETSPSNANTFCLASTVNVHLLAEQAMSSPEIESDVVQPPPYMNNTGDQEKNNKVKNAVSVIGKALGGSSDSLDKKSSTLPRRKSKADFVQPTPFIVPMPSKPPGEFRSEIRHMVNSPAPVTQRTEVSFPVAAAPSPTPSPAAKTVTRQGNQSREHIIPIKFEQEPVSSQPPPGATPIRKSSSQQSQQNISRTSSRSLSRQSTADSDSSICSSGDPIRKSAREVIIPIAVEGGGYITPSSSALNRINSITESEDDGSASGSATAPRCFTLRSTRRRAPSHTDSPGTSKSVLQTADSVSSDEDDDNFEILTAENLFSTLLSRVRSLTQRLNTDEHRSAFPRSLFHQGSVFDNPGSRLSETRSFSRADGIHPWRRSLSREPISGGSSTTLPRDRSKSSHRSTLNSSPQSSRDDQSPYRSRLRPPITIKNSLSKQLMKERLDELDGIDKANETKVKSRHNGANSNNAEYLAKVNHSEPYVYKMRTRQRTNTIEPGVDSTRPNIYHMRTRNRSNSSELVNETPELCSPRVKRPISIHESLDNNSPVARRIYQRSFSCDRNKINAILKDSAKILEKDTDETIPPPVQSFKRTNSLRQPANFDRKKEYRRSFSTNTTGGYKETSVLERYLPNSSSSGVSSLERVLSPTRNVSRYLRSSMYEPSELTNISSNLRDSSVGLDSSSRIKNTIRSLRESSVGPETSIDSESNLIKRAIALESKNSTVEPRSSVYRTHSLKQKSPSSKNVYKDFISKIVNSREGNVSRSVFNEKNNTNVKNDFVKGYQKTGSGTNSKEESPCQNEVTEEREKEKLESNETVATSDRQIPRISRFLRYNNEKTNEDTLVGSKLPTRLTPNSEPILLRNRRYSIPRLNGTNRDVSRKRTTDSDEPEDKTVQSNGHLSESEVGQLKAELLKDQTESKGEDNSLKKVEKVINNLQNAQNKSKLQRLDLSKIHSRDSATYDRSSMSRSLDHCDNSSRCSFRSPTEDSDGWSVCSDLTDIRGDCPSPNSPSSAHEETVSERIRRKSFFSRFNPMRSSGGEQASNPTRLQSYVRSSSADNPNTSQRGLLRPRKSFLKTGEIK